MDKFSDRVHQVVDPELESIRDLLLDSDNKQGERPENLGLNSGVKSEVNKVEHRQDEAASNNPVLQWMKETFQKFAEKAGDTLSDYLNDVLDKILPDLELDLGELGGGALDAMGDTAQSVVNAICTAVLAGVVDFKTNQLKDKLSDIYTFMVEKLNKIQAQRATDRARFEQIWDAYSREFKQYTDLFDDTVQSFKRDVHTITDNQTTIIQYNSSIYDLVQQLITNINEFIQSVNVKLTDLSTEVNLIHIKLNGMDSKLDALSEMINGITAEMSSNPNFGLVSSEQNFQKIIGTLYGPRGSV